MHSAKRTSVVPCLLPVFLAVFLFCLLWPASSGAEGPQLTPQVQPDPGRAIRLLTPASLSPLPVPVTSASVPVTPYLEYVLDENDYADIDEIAGEKYKDKFQLFSLDRLPASSGTLWLRFVLPTAQPGAGQNKLVLDLGPSVPGTPVLYYPALTEDGAVAWREQRPAGSFLALPESMPAVSVPCYLRVDGLPGLWFSPSARTAESALDTDLDWHLISCAALATILLFCLFKGFCEPGQWRLWALLYLACALAQCWSGTAPVGMGYTARTLAAMCCPGLALMLWPHVGRHFLSSVKVSRGLDTSLILLCLPGAALALLPLVPQFAWVSRWCQLWPLAMILFLPSALWACLLWTPACLRFLLGTLIPAAAAAASVLGLKSALPPDLLAALPALGVALGALFMLALSRKPDSAEAPLTQKKERGTDAMAPAGGLSLNLSAPAAEKEVETVELGAPIGGTEETFYTRWIVPLKALQTSLEKIGTEDLPIGLGNEISGLIAKSRDIEGTLTELEEQAKAERLNAARLNVIVVSANQSFCAVINHVLRREDCSIRLASTLEDALVSGRRVPARLYIFEGAYSSVESGYAIAALKELRCASGLPSVFLAYTRDESNWRSLAKAGFTHALLLPIDDLSLINTLKELRDEDTTAVNAQPARPASAPRAEVPAAQAEPAPQVQQVQAQKPVQMPAQKPAQQTRTEVPDLFGPAPVKKSGGMKSSPLQTLPQSIDERLEKTGADLNLSMVTPKADAEELDLFSAPLSMYSRIGGQKTQGQLLAEAFTACGSGDFAAVSAAVSSIAAGKAGRHPVMEKLVVFLGQACDKKDGAAVRDLLSEMGGVLERRSGSRQA